MPATPARRLARACATLALVAAALLGAARRAQGPPASPTAGSGADPMALTLELSAQQLHALTLEAARTFEFPLEKSAVGSISFEEDPATVQAEATLIGAAATLQLSTQELTRVTALGEDNGIPQREFEQARANAQSAHAALAAAREALRALGKSDAEIERLIRSGRIAYTPPRGRKWALANVAESDSVLVRPGQAVSVRVMAYPQRSFQGEVSKVYATVDPLTHRVALRALLADPANELRAGMLADFTIRVRAPLPTTAIPVNAAVREADGTTTVWVTGDRHRFTPRTVTTGERSASWVQVLAGVRAGELVVADGAVFLSNMLHAPPSD